MKVDWYNKNSCGLMNDLLYSSFFFRYYNGAGSEKNEFSGAEVIFYFQ